MMQSKEVKKKEKNFEMHKGRLLFTISTNT